MVLEDLIGQFLYGSKGNDNKIVAMRQLLRQVMIETTEPVGTTK